MYLRHVALCVCLVVVATPWNLQADPPGGEAPVQVSFAQKDLLSLEPILVTVRSSEKLLPAEVGKLLRFDIKPAVKPRPGAKPLPIEAHAASGAKCRAYDLLEWYQFPADGKFTVQAIVEKGSASLTSTPVTITIRRPAKDDAEWGPVDRLHHIPWSNYCTDQFCGDTFDVVKRWPKSQLTPYCHYWSGVFNLHKKEHDKAAASFKSALEHKGFMLATDAEIGTLECLLAAKSQDGLGRVRELRKQFAASKESPRDAVLERIAVLEAEFKSLAK